MYMTSGHRKAIWVHQSLFWTLQTNKTQQKDVLRLPPTLRGGRSPAAPRVALPRDVRSERRRAA